VCVGVPPCCCERGLRADPHPPRARLEETAIDET
jgi:hypothetical protein